MTLTDASIRLKLSFDYSRDTNFVKPPINPDGLVEYRLEENLEIQKNCGWFSMWGKEIEKFNPAAPGGSGFVGQWTHIRRKFEWTTHPEDASCSVVSEIETSTHLPNGTQNSPAILAFTLETVRYVVMLHKLDAIALETTEKLVGDNKQSSVTVKGLRMPFPPNAAWKNLDGFARGRPTPANARNICDVMITLEVGSDLAIGVTVLDAKPVGAFQTEVLCPKPPHETLLYDENLLADMAQMQSPFGAIVKLGAEGENNKLLTCDPQVRMQTDTAPPRAPAVDFATPPFVPPKGHSKVTFEPPPDLDLPQPPDGYEFALNIRGLLFMQKLGEEGVPLWPHEVFDVDKLHEKIDRLLSQQDPSLAARELERLERQRDRVLAMFDYMEQVALGLANTSRMFGM